ncbi:conserved domain protein [Parvimonas sp. oral taxon 393 str. F0440]|nr:conserved domain protein [Parvimonas sp. oral taxon 393 str. F0440]
MHLSTSYLYFLKTKNDGNFGIKNVDFGGSTQTSLANSINSSESNGQISINTSFLPRFFFVESKSQSPIYSTFEKFKILKSR